MVWRDGFRVRQVNALPGEGMYRGRGAGVGRSLAALITDPVDVDSSTM